MPRHKQDGLRYFSLDVDFFHGDKRIVKLHKRFGNDGIVFYIYLLTEIYRNGYYVKWDEDLIDDAIDLNLTEGFVKQVMSFLTERSLIKKITLHDGNELQAKKEDDDRPQCEFAGGGNGQERAEVITSPGIQKRYQAAMKSLKRDVAVDGEIWLLEEEETESFIKVTINEDKSQKNSDKSQKNSDKSQKNDTKETKLKEIKLKETKLKETNVCVRIEDFIAAYPKDCNRHLTEVAYADLVMHGLETEENLVACARNYADACKALETPDKYIKNAQNFLKDMTFEKYLPRKYKKPEAKKSKNQFLNFEQREYDFADLESRLLERQRGGDRIGEKAK